MALVLDEDQLLVRDTAIEFARNRVPTSNLRQLRDTADATGFDAAAWQEMVELGWSGMLIPEDLGGSGFGFTGLGLVMESLGRTLAATPMLSTVVLSGTAIAACEQSELTRELLASIAAGKGVIALASEESTSHAPHSIATRAVRSGEGFVLSGRKRFVIDGHVADKLLVVARVGELDSSDSKSAAIGPEHSDLSLILVDANAPGVRRQRLQMVDSRNSADVVFDNARVPASAVLSTDAAAIINAALDRGRILLAAEMLGMAQEAFDITLAYLKQRTQFGVPIGSFQALKHRAVQMYADIELSKSVVLAALTALDQSSADIPRLASLCKARLNDTLMLVSNEAVQMHGGIGVTDEIDVGLFLKRARVAQAMLGSSSFHRVRYAGCSGF